MIVTINGNPMDWANGIADKFIEWEAESILKPLQHALYTAVHGGAMGIAEMMPELATFAVMVCVSIGMFSQFGRWVGRAAAIYAGGAVWIVLAYKY